MTMMQIVEAIETAGKPLTPAELSAEMGIAPGLVVGMLDALRANGMLAPDGSGGSPPDGCAAGSSCGGGCPGSGSCPLVMDLGLEGLAPR